jgi:hypothetical protein
MIIEGNTENVSQSIKPPGSNYSKRICLTNKNVFLNTVERLNYEKIFIYL